MKPDGVASVFGPGLAEGPFPEHYEALECPVEKNSMSGQRINPTIKIFGDKMDTFASCDMRFPFVGTTYRVTEHWQTGCMTRHCSWLLEMQPQNFVEMSTELAKESETDQRRNGCCLLRPGQGKGSGFSLRTVQTLQDSRFNSPSGWSSLAFRLAVSGRRQRL